MPNINPYPRRAINHSIMRAEARRKARDEAARQAAEAQTNKENS